MFNSVKVWQVRLVCDIVNFAQDEDIINEDAEDIDDVRINFKRINWQYDLPMEEYPPVPLQIGGYWYVGDRMRKIVLVEHNIRDWDFDLNDEPIPTITITLEELTVDSDEEYKELANEFNRAGWYSLDDDTVVPDGQPTIVSK